MAQGIGEWLRSIGLERYLPAFVENDVDLAILPHLNDDDLKEMGLPLGARRRVQVALSSGDAVGSVAPEPVVDEPARAERRQLTLVFCDLVGSTALATRTDPEDMCAVLTRFQDCCTAEVARFGGYVAKFMGDGALAYFGYPEAHEDDAERAINAALGIVAALADQREVGGDRATPPVRIGIATGPVVVGDLIGKDAAQEAAVIGETPNLAARLQGVAAPDTVVIDTATEVLAGGHFVLADLGLHELRGFDAPRRAWAVTGRSRTGNRFAAQRRQRLTELVGRDEELEILQRRWRRARAGEGQLVLVAGEPGIGKSRLVHGVVESVADEPHFRLRYQCSPFHVNSAFHPVIERIERSAGFETSDTDAERLDKLGAAVRLAGRSPEDDVPLLAGLVSVPLGDRYSEPALTPQRRKELVISALVAQLVGLSEQRPVLFLFEDAHWMDPTTQELLDVSIEHLRDLPVLMLVTHRPGFLPPWTGRAQVTSMTLNRLDRRASAQLVSDVCGDRELPQGVVEQIVAKTDGIPLFVEEFTRAALESECAAIAIPATLQDVLESRLGRLDVGREVAQVAAAIGRGFDYALLAAASGEDDERLCAALDELVAARLVFARGMPPDATYRFKHALVQDTAYASLLRERRADIHGRIANALESSFPGVVEDEPEVVAQHFTLAGRTVDAVPYWQRAGEIAARRSAPAESISHFERAIELVHALPPDDATRRRELALQIHLAPVYMASKAFGAPEADQAYRRATELATALRDDDSAFTAQWGLWMISLMRPATQDGESRRIVAALHERAAASGESGHRLQACHAAWSTHFMEGRVDEARSCAEEATRIYDPEAHGHHRHLYGGHDPGSCARSFLSLALMLGGQSDAAIAASERALEISDATRHLPTRSGTHTLKALLHMLRGDVDAVDAHIEASIALAEQHGIPTAMWGDVYRGWVIGQRVGPREGRQRMLRTIDAVASAGQGPLRAYYLSLVAELALREGEPEEGLQHVAHGLELCDRSGHAWCAPELHRVRGRLLTALGRADDDVDAEYRSALDLARVQGARLWELRAASNRAERLAARGLDGAARDALAPIVDAFPDGGALPDIEDARALLAKLR